MSKIVESNENIFLYALNFNLTNLYFLSILGSSYFKCITITAQFDGYETQNSVISMCVSFKKCKRFGNDYARSTIFTSLIKIYYK